MFEILKNNLLDIKNAFFLKSAVYELRFEKNILIFQIF